MTRRLVQLIARGLIGVLLFAQLAIAAYACPALSLGAMGSGSASMEMAGSTVPFVDASVDTATQAPLAATWPAWQMQGLPTYAPSTASSASKATMHPR